MRLPARGDGRVIPLGFGALILLGVFAIAVLADQVLLLVGRRR